MCKQLTYLLFCFLLTNSFSVKAQNFLSTNGTAIVNESGDTVLLRGMGLGGWMLQEGYMLQTAGFASPQWAIKEKIEELIGPANTETFYEAWLANHVRKVDVDALKSWGFNSIRLPMHYNLFTLPIQEEPVEGEHTWLDKGFELTDSLIDWCKQNEMYVILDLHGAPGGQGYDQAISDYNPDYPSLWESDLNKEKTVALWARLAERYADEEWVAGYDFLNETNWNLGGNVLRNLYTDITEAIRAVDPDHIIFIEGNWFANDFTGLTPPWDDNLVYSPHKYWSVNDQASIQWVLDMQEDYNVPLYVGESGENSNTWFRDAIKLLEDRGIGWAWWPMKKVQSIAGPLSVVKSPEYQALLDYWSNGGTTPDTAFAMAALMDLTEKFKIENCIFQKDVIDAMFRQVQSDEAIPYNTQTIPGVMYSTDFDMGVVGSAYFDTDLATYHVTTGNFTAWNNGWAYRNDGVDIEITEDNVNTNGYNVGWLNTGEWMQYSVDVQNSAVYDIHIRVATESSDGQFHFSAEGSELTSIIDVPNTGGWQNWETIVVPGVILDTDDEKITFHVDNQVFNMGSFEFIETGATVDLPTEFLFAKTLDENTVQLNINKPLAGPLPASPADFYIFKNGSTVNITSTTLDTDNTRIIRFDVNTMFTSSDVITISYIGEDIDATDGTILNEFIIEPVQNNIVELHQIPGRIEAEAYEFAVGIQLEETMDVDGVQNIGYLDVGDYLDYIVYVNEVGTYEVSYRTASESEGGSIKLQLVDEDGSVTDMNSIMFPSTGGWQEWTTTTASVPFFSTGEKKIRILITESLFNMNWFEFSVPTSTDEITGNEFKVYPNPSNGQFYLEGDFIQDEPLTLNVYNLLGERMLSQNMDATGFARESINLRDASAGVYVLVLRSEDGIVWRERVLVE